MLSIFSCACWPSVCLPSGGMSIKVFLFFNWVFCFLCCWVVWAVCIFWRLCLVGYIICNYFIPFHNLSFFFFLISFAGQKLLSLIRSHWFFFVFISIALGNWPKKTFVQLMSENVLPMFSSMCSVLLWCFVLCLSP